MDSDSDSDTLLIGPMDGARGRGAALVAVATEPKNFLVCAGTLWVDTPVSPRGTTPPHPCFAGTDEISLVREAVMRHAKLQ